MSAFSLPSLKQDQFSTFYNKKIELTDELEETVIYPGIQLSVSSKSRNLKNNIKPCNVFITKCTYKDGRADKFMHKIYGNDNQWTILPKRLYSVCFPKIHLGSIPKNNRINLRLTDNIHVELPFVPDEFYKQKQMKATRPSKPVTRRNKRSRIQMEQLEENSNYQGWKVYDTVSNDSEKINKKQIITLLRSIMEKLDKKNMVVKNPFADVEDLTSNEITPNLIPIIQFVYHYIRDDLNMQSRETVPLNDDLWEKLKKQF